MPICKNKFLISTFLIAGAVTLSTPSFGGEYFSRISSFPVDLNLPEGVDRNTETSAEIIAASEDGKMLVYSDSPYGAIGMIDIQNPQMPEPLGLIKLDGEPTSVSIKHGLAFVGVNTTQDLKAPSGSLITINLKSQDITNSCDLGGQPDSVAISDDGTLAAVAIENERDEDLNKGAMPQGPAGFVAILRPQHKVYF